MISVLHVAQPVDGGVGRFVVDLAAAQRAAGVEVTVASPPGWLADALAAGGVPWARWDATRSPGPATAGEVRRLRQVVATTDPDVVHLHSSKAGLAGRLLLRGSRPTIFQPHGWAWQAVTGATAAAATAWERTALRWTSALVCVSDDERAAGDAHGVRSARTRVVRNGVDLVAFGAAAPDRAAARAAVGLPGAPVVVVCIGRLNEQKGQEVLVRAWPRVLDRHPDALLVLVGAGPDAGALRDLARDLGAGHAVRLPGEDMDVARWYAAADVVAFPSRWGEAMPLAPLEAMASGRPLVATDVAGVREALGPGCGAVVPAGDVDAMAGELLRRVDDAGLREREGTAARAWAESRHDVRVTHERLTALAVELGGRAAARRG